MNCSSPVCDIEALGQLEKRFRHRLDTEPGDTGARLSLAWCLVVQALYEAGQERMLTQLIAATDELGEAASKRIHAAAAAGTAGTRQRSAGQLLHCCLRQALMVTQLSRDPLERADAEKLRTLISLSGGEQAVSESDEEAARILHEITRAITSESGEPAAADEMGNRYSRERYP